MQLKARYDLAPQMKEYDKMMTAWFPYLMFFHKPFYASSVVNTDSRGFRVVYKKSRCITRLEDVGSSPVGILSGGSIPFGVGATHDRNTIPSLLSEYDDHLWLNFSGRAFVSTQELLLFLLYHHHLSNLKKIVILSGTNNFFLYYLCRHYNRDLGSFYYWDEFNRAMNSEIIPQRKKLFQAFFGTIRAIGKKSKGKSAGYGEMDIKGISEKILDHDMEKEMVLGVLKNNIIDWQLLSRSLGVELTYVLEPVAWWRNKILSKEEESLFHELDDMQTSVWKSVSSHINDDFYVWLRNGIKQICAEQKIRFFDMNDLMSKRNLDGSWIYVDRVHFNDEGYKIIAGILKEEVLNG